MLGPVRNRRNGRRKQDERGEIKNETATNAIGEVRDSSNATAVTPIRTRRNGDVAASD